MATTVRSSSSNSASTGTAISVTAPTGTTTGDLVIVTITHNNEAALSDNNGATPFTEDLEYTPSVGGFGRLAVYSRRIQAGDPTTYNFTSSGAGSRWSIVAVTFQNPNPTTIYDVAPVGNDSAGVPGTTGTASSITTTTANAIHVIMCAQDGANNATTGTPATYTVEKNVTTNQCQTVVDKAIAVVGATGTQTWTYTSSLDWVAINMAIKDESPTGIKTIIGLAKASVKTTNGLAIASVKTVNGLA